jgi:hypothetical protein
VKTCLLIYDFQIIPILTKTHPRLTRDVDLAQYYPRI